jgi:M6 family metalloprotease-like protein
MRRVSLLLLRAKSIRYILWGLVLACIAIHAALAMEQPQPGMLDRMKASGTYPAAAAFAQKLGNQTLKRALRGTALPASLAPQEIADCIAAELGRNLDQRSAKQISAASAQELSWTQLDLNGDRTVDERDVLALGFARPKESARFPSLGTSKTFCLLLEFPEYPHYFPQEDVQNNLFGEGTDSFTYRSLHHYYEVSSYGLLNVAGQAYGWHMASHPRAWYHPDDSLDYGYSWDRQAQLVEEAILAYDARGEDFSQYDGDGDGSVDYFLAVYTGPVGDWATFWWGYFGVGLPGGFRVDGVNFPAYSWQWERGYGFGQTPPEPPHWDPGVTVHETGHALGLPDYYDYDGGVGPGGGVGGLDIMDGWGDHGCFSKFILGWLTPTIAFSNFDDFPLREANAYGDCVIFMPGFDPVTPWAEYFIAQNRTPVGLDSGYPGSGLMLWHIDARVNPGGGFMYDNSYTEHKLIKLLEADGLDDIENWRGGNAGDFYVNGSVLSPASYPSSDRYDGSATGATCDDISEPGSLVTADFTLYTSNPPSVHIDSPASGSDVSGTLPVLISASDDVGVSKVQLLIDGQLVAELGSAPYSYSWNTLVDFNKTLQLTARAWDAEGQSASATIEVTVSNGGVTSITDDFESGLMQWRALDVVMEGRGQGTHWRTRISPSDPWPLGNGKEAWVAPANPDDWFGALDYLRSQRINATSFTQPVHIRFNYRGRSGFALYRSIDNGASWVKLDDLPDSYDWRVFNRVYPLQGNVVYLRFAYTGDIREQGDGSDNGRGANIDDLLVRQAPSDVPTAVFTNPLDGDDIAGSVTFAVDAVDDTGVAKVDFYINNGLVSTDTEAPYEYQRDTTGDDNVANMLVEARAEDIDGLPSAAAQIHVNWKNPHPYPNSEAMEYGSPNWWFQNDGNQPQWRMTDRESVSRPCCLGWEIESGPCQTDNYEGAWFIGGPVSAGRQAVDLAGDTVNDPVLRFRYKASFPSGESMSVYLYNTWFGWEYVTGFSDNQSEWVEKTISLAPWIGQSAQLCFWIWPTASTDGTGLWIDDLWFGNRGPAITALNPNPASAGTVVTADGSGFGADRLDSYVTYDGVTLDESAYVTWSDDTLQVTVPDAAASGYMQVVVVAQSSNRLWLEVGYQPPALLGLDAATVYAPTDDPALSAATGTATQRVLYLLDGQPVWEAVTAPYDGYHVPLSHLHNGIHRLQLRAYRGSESAFSPEYDFTVYSLPGDIDADGTIGWLDQAALVKHLGLVQGAAGFMPWYDPNVDGIVNEADLAYLGYHFGESLPIL